MGEGVNWGQEFAILRFLCHFLLREKKMGTDKYALKIAIFDFNRRDLLGRSSVIPVAEPKKTGQKGRFQTPA